MAWRRWSLVVLLVLAGVMPVFWRGAQASLSDNIRGLANSLYGYISFNCLDDDFAGRFPFIFTFRFNVPACSLSNHGVNLGLDNKFTGQAWNPTLGYIDMNPAGPPPDNYASTNAHCQSPCNASNCLSCYNEIDQRVYGWARQAVTDGEWIELNSAVNPPTMMTNYAAPTPGIFSGYASSSFGAISFNCTNDSSCGTFDYKVYFWKLDLEEMSAPNWSFAEACSGGARKAVFKWSRRGGTQSAYRVIVNTVNSTSSPVFDSGKIYGVAQQLACPGPNCVNIIDSSIFTPAYNTTYYWWLQLWNNNDEETEYFQFNTDVYGSQALTDNVIYNQTVNPDDDNLTFTTYRHEFPTPFFTWTPFEPIVGSSTEFISNSAYYSGVGPGASQPCVGGNCTLLWTASDPAAIISSTNTPTTSITFVNIRPQTVSLAVTDQDQYTCSMTSPTLTINFELPIWKEVKAQ